MRGHYAGKSHSELFDEERMDVIGQNGNDGYIYHHNHKHGHASNKKGLSPTYRSWQSMKNRCCNPNDNKYPRYGGRGITLQESWNTFLNFLADMGERPEGTTLGRIDNEGNYEKQNCRWETIEQQASNKSTTALLTYRGETKTLAEWQRFSGIPRTTFYRRFYEKGLRGEDLFKETCHMKNSYEENTNDYHYDEGHIE